jgi:hypothetical protein
MTVAELIVELQGKPQDAVVLLYLSGSEDCESAGGADDPITLDGEDNPEGYYCKGDHPGYQNKRLAGKQVVHIRS